MIYDSEIPKKRGEFFRIGSSHNGSTRSEKGVEVSVAAV
jgi:hypothetical protein